MSKEADNNNNNTEAAEVPASPRAAGSVPRRTPKRKLTGYPHRSLRDCIESLVQRLETIQETHPDIWLDDDIWWANQALEDHAETVARLVAQNTNVRNQHDDSPVNKQQTKKENNHEK